jgi:prepilin-type N-terminal cleavage/methylation domain-containing protein
VRCVLRSTGSRARAQFAPRLAVRAGSVDGRRTARTVRGAFTLFELLLVLAILALLAGMSWPFANGWVRGQALRQSAADVRVVLDRARVHAVQNGIMYAFYFEPGGRHFLALPAEIPLDAPAPDPVGSARGAAAGMATGAPAGTNRSAMQSEARNQVVPFEYYFGELPEGVVFSQVVPLAATPGRLNPRMFESLPEAVAIEDITNWSQPLIYEADGTADDHVLEILTESTRHAITLELRGFTGTIRTSDVHLEGRG